MKVIRSKRPDKIECSWGRWNVILQEDGSIYITQVGREEYLFINDKDTKQLIKALQIIIETK